MKKIVVASGKGGVGKSMTASVLACLAAGGQKVAAVDADVDAPNLHLWLGQDEKWEKSTEVTVTARPVIDLKKCTGCGRCVDFCRFGALDVKNGKPVLVPYFCEGCGACEEVCPEKAIKLEPVVGAAIKERRMIIGKLAFSLISGQLYPGEMGSGKIVEQIKEKAGGYKSDLMIIDAPAGAGCPVIAAVKGSDFAVLVTEPTPAARADLKKAKDVARHFGIDYGVVINKWDLHRELSEKIKSEAGVRFLGQMGYDRGIVEALTSLTPLIKTKLAVVREIEDIYDKIKNRVI